MKKTYRKYTPFVTGAANSTTALNAVVNSLQDDVQQLYMDFLSRYEYVTTGIPRWKFRDSSVLAPAGDKQLRNLEIGISNPNVVTFNGRSKTQIGNTELQLSYGPRNSFPHEETTLAMDVPFCTFKFQDLAGHVGFLYFVPKNTTLGACFTKDTTIRLRENTALTVDTATVTGYGTETAVAYGANTFYTKYDFEFCLDVTGANSLANLVAILNGIVASPFDVYTFDPTPITIDNTEYSAITSYDRYGIFYDQAFNLTISSSALEKVIEYVAEMFAFNPTIPPVGSQEKTYIIYAKLPYVLFADPVNSTEGILTTSTKNPSDFSLASATSIVRSWDDEFVTSQIIGAGSFYGDKFTLIPLFWRTWDLFASIDGTSVEKNDLYLDSTPFVNNTFIPSVLAGTVVIPLSGTNSHTHTFIKNSGTIPGVWESYVNLTSNKELFVEVNNTPLIYGSSSALKLGSTGAMATTTSILSGNATYLSVSPTYLNVYSHHGSTSDSLTIRLDSASRTARFGSSSLATDYDGVLRVVAGQENTCLVIAAKDRGFGSTYKTAVLAGVHEPGTINKDYLYTTLVTDPAQDKSYIFSSALNGLEIGITDRAVSDYDNYITGGLDYTKTTSGSVRVALVPKASATESGEFIVKNATKEFFTLKEVQEAGGSWYSKIYSDSGNSLLSFGTIEETAVSDEFSGVGVRVVYPLTPPLPVPPVSSEVIIVGDYFSVYSETDSTPELVVERGIITAPKQFGFQFGLTSAATDIAVVFETNNSSDNPYDTNASKEASLLFSRNSGYMFSTTQEIDSSLQASIKASVVKTLQYTDSSSYYFYIPSGMSGYYYIEAILPTGLCEIDSSTMLGPGSEYTDFNNTNRFIPYLEFIQLGAPIPVQASISDAINYLDDPTNREYTIKKSFNKQFAFSTVGHSYFSLDGLVSMSAYLTAGKYYIFKIGSAPTSPISGAGTATLNFSRNDFSSGMKHNGTMTQPIFGSWTPGDTITGMSVKFIKLH